MFAAKRLMLIRTHQFVARCSAPDLNFRTWITGEVQNADPSCHFYLKVVSKSRTLKTADLKNLFMYEKPNCVAWLNPKITLRVHKGWSLIYSPVVLFGITLNVKCQEFIKEAMVQTISCSKCWTSVVVICRHTLIVLKIQPYCSSPIIDRSYLFVRFSVR